MIYLAGTDFSHLTTDELIEGIKALDLPGYIRSKAYGVDVRETLAQMTEMLMQLAYNQGMNPQQAKEWVSKLNNKIDKGEVTMSDLSQEIKEALTGGAVAVVGVNAVGSENIKDGAVTANKLADNSIALSKLGFKYDFSPVLLTFARRDISPSGYSDSIKRFSSEFIIFDKKQIEVVNLEDEHQIALVAFNVSNVGILSTDWYDSSIDISKIMLKHPNAYKYAVKVRRKDDAPMSSSLAEVLTNTIFVKTTKYPTSYNYVNDIVLNRWLMKFNSSNFDTSPLSVNGDGNLILSDDISTTSFHKYLLYYDTDIQREIKTVKASFVSDVGGISSNRIFVESSDGRVVWFGYSESGLVDAYSLNKHTGSFSVISKQYTSTTPAYPTQDGVAIEFKVALIGLLAVVYIDNEIVCSYDLSAYVGDKVNRTGISFRGSASTKSILKSFNVDYKNDPFVHISVDDVFSILKDLTENQSSYASLFDHPDFNFLKEMHDTYGAVFSLYVYNRVHDDTFTISDMTTKYKFEFAANATWLKFGYHSDWEDTKAVDLEDTYLISNVESVYADIARFASYRSIDKLPRFGFFSANKSALLGLRDKGLILGALTADDDRASNTGLDGVALSVLKVADFLEEDGLSYFKSETRLDGLSQTSVISNLNTLSDNLFNQNAYILFAHSINQTAFRAAIEWANGRRIKFDYPINNI